MDGILTSNGISEWIGGAKKFVKEWDRAYIDTVQSAKIIMFSESNEGAAICNSANALVAALAAVHSDTSLKSKGVFAHKNWKATQLALSVERSTIITNVVGADVVPLPADFRELESRAWFSLYFAAGNEPHDEGTLTDFPEGRGFGGHLNMTTAAATETAVAALLSNGAVGQGPNPLRTPYQCTPDTRARLEIEFLHGALALTVDTGIIARIYGYEG